MPLDPNIISISEQPTLIDQVITLAARNKQTLGFLPDQAFHTQAAKGNILIAESGGTVLGYLLYRVLKGKPKASITHLCIDEGARGRGLSARLVESLKRRTTDLWGISLKCRADYEVPNSLWPKLNFVALSERDGRSKAGSTLVCWWYGHGHHNLVEEAWIQSTDGKVTVALDHNVHIDITDNRNEESSALDADWLSEHVQICPTVESFNEIMRCPNEETRHRRRAVLKGCRTLEADLSHHGQLIEFVSRTIFGNNTNERNQSDIRQLLHAAKGGASFFLTRDERILKHAPEIGDKLNLQILHPAEFLEYFDDVMGLARHPRTRLEGSANLSIERYSNGLHQLSTQFLHREFGEVRKDFLRTLRGCQADRSKTPRFIVAMNDEGLTALAATTCSDGILRVPVLRASQLHISRCTLLAGLLSYLLQEALREDVRLVQVEDRYIPPYLTEALYAKGFRLLADRNGWGKVLLRGAIDHGELESSLRDSIGGSVLHLVNGSQLQQELVHNLSQPPTENEIRISELEELLWPLKITGTNYPTYVVPIKPQWAMRLFDHRLASTHLFGSEEALAFSNENVYYRAPRPPVGSQRGRLLWYVSQSSKWPGSGAVRAISSLRSVEVGPASSVYRRYQRLGVYAWPDVLSVGGHAKSNVMALRFAGSYQLEKPISFKEMNQLISDAGGKKNHFQSVFRVSDAVLRKVLQHESE